MEQERIAKRQEYAEKQMAGSMNAQSMMAAQAWMKKLEEREDIQKRSIENQQKEVTRHETLVEIARETLAKSAAEVKAIEKSKEKWEEKRKREMQSKTEAEMDEISQALFQRRKDQ
jgi:flagellar export protein FliJ